MSKLTVASFTNVGYRFHSRLFNPIESDLSDQTAVVTGATGGIGLETARGLADLGCRVIVVGRDEEKLSDAENTVGGDVLAMRADLSLMSEVRELGRALLDTEPRIDILVNNVGVLFPERRVTREGIEATLAVNLLGHFLITNLLLPRMIEHGSGRVVNVSSGGMYSEKIHPHDLHFDLGHYRGTAAYARTKRAQVILTEMWAERMKETGVVVHAMHPGWARTQGVADSLPTFNRVMSPFLRTPAQGADTVVWLAADPQPLLSTGKFWFDRRLAPTHLTDATRETAEDRSQLWDNLFRLTGADLPVGQDT